MKGILLTSACLLAILVQSDAAVDIVNLIREVAFPRNPKLTRVKTFEETKGRGPYDVAYHFNLMVSMHGYPAEEHNVTTEDGYKLKLHRIPGSPRARNVKDKPVIFMQHGLFASSDSWVLFGPNKDLVFYLADAGCDVWIGNYRGNSYTRSHERLTTADAEFWKYSYHENGVYDIPAMIDYALSYTGKRKLVYIGHSMGTTGSFVLLSMRPEYNEKISLLVSLAPVAYWRHDQHPLVDAIYAQHNIAKDLLYSLGIYDLFPQNDLTAALAKLFCGKGAPTQHICVFIVELFAGANPAQMEPDWIGLLARYYPSGASFQSPSHYYQNIISGNFEAYDYGYKENLIRHNSPKPPSYNVSKITAPTAIFYSLNDGFVHVKDVMELKKRLPNIVYFHEISDPLFTHADFIWAKNAKDVLYAYVLKILTLYKDA